MPDLLMDENTNDIFDETVAMFNRYIDSNGAAAAAVDSTSGSGAVAAAPSAATAGVPAPSSALAPSTTGTQQLPPPPSPASGHGSVAAKRKQRAAAVAADDLVGANSSSELYYAHDNRAGIRTFHELVMFVNAYETFTREERLRLVSAANESLRPAERSICDGHVTRRPVRDILRVLWYGARVNGDLIASSCCAAWNIWAFRGSLSHTSPTR